MADQGIDISGLQKEIQGLTAALLVVDARIEKVASDVSTLDKVFGSIQGLKDFVSTIKDLDTASAKSFRQASEGIDSLTRGLKRLSSFKINSNSLNNKSSGLLSFVNQLNEQIANTNVGNIEKIGKIGTFIRSISIAITSGAVNDLTPENATRISSFFKVLANGLSESSAIQSNVDSLVKTTTLIRRIANTIASGALKNFNIENAAHIGGFFVALSTGLGSINVASNIGELSKITTLVKRTVEVAGQVDNLNLNSANKIGDFFNTLSTSLNQVHPSDNADAITQLVSNLKKTTALVSGDTFSNLNNDNANKISDFFKALSNGLLNSTKDLAGNTSLSSLDNVTSSLKRVSGVIAAVNEASKDLPKNTGILGKLGIGSGSKFAGLKEYVSFVSFLSNQLGSLATKISSQFDVSALDSLITSISKISTALPRIIEASKTLPKGSAISNFFAGLTGYRIGKFKGLKEFLSFVQFLATQISNISAKTANTEGFDSLTKTIDSIKGVSRAIPAIIEASKTLPTGSRVGNFLGSISGLKVGKFKNLKDFFDFVRFIAQQLTRLPKNIPNVGDAFQGIANLSTVLEGVDITNTQNVKGFKQYVGQLVSGLDELDKLKIDTKRLTSIGTALSALPKTLPGVIGSTGVNNSDAQTIQSVVTNILKIQNTNAVFRTVLEGVGKLIIGFTQLDQKVVNFLQSTGDKFKAFGQQITQLGQSLIQNLGFNKFFQLPGLDIAKQFDKITAQLKVAGFSKQQIKDAQDFSDIIGIKYPLSANQALDAILSLKKAGQDLPDIKKVLPTAADLASLTESGNLDAVTNTLIAVGNGFNQLTDSVKGGFDNISVASDQISAAADASTASIESLQEGIANVGPSANQMGLTFQDTVAILAEFDQGLLKGAEGGTALRSVLNQLVRKQTVDELTKLNVAIQNQDGTFRNLDTIFKDLNKRYAELHFSQSDIAKSLGTMFDTFARGGASILLARNGISDIKAEMAKSKTTAEKFNESMDNLIGDTSQLQGSMETLLKDGFLPLINRAFRPVIQLVTKVVNALIGLPPAIKDTVINTVLLGSAFATIIGGGAVLVGTLAQISGGFLSMSATVTRLAINIIPTIGSVGALASSLLVALPILALAGAAFVTLGFYTTSFFNAIENNIGGAGDALKILQGAVSSFFDTVQGIGKKIGFAYNEVFGPIVALARENFGKDVANFFNKITVKIQAFNKALSGITVENIAKAFTTLAPIVTDTVNALQASGSGLLQALLGDAAGIEKFKSSFARVLRDVTLGVARVTGANLAKAIFAFNSGDITGGVNALLNNIGNALRSLIVKNRNIIQTGVEFLVKFFSPFSKISTILKLIGLEKLAGVFDEITNRIFGSVKAALNVIFDLLSGKSLRQSFNENFGQIGDSISNFIDQIQISFQQISKIINVIASQFIPAFQQIGVDLGNIDFTSAIKGILDLATNGLQFINENILIPIADNLPKVIEFIKKLSTAASEALGPLVTFGNQIFSRVVNAFSELTDVLAHGANFEAWAEDTLASLSSIIKTLPFRIGQTLFNFGKLFNSEFLMNLGAALAQGDISGIVSTLIQQLLAIISSVISRIPFLIKDLGKSLHSQFLISIGQALQVGDLKSLVSILKDGIVNLFKNAFDGAVKAIDNFIDLFDNRVVGGIVLALGVSLVAALPFVIPVLVGAITGLFGIVAGLVVAPIQALGSLLGVAFLSSITFPAVGIAALVAGFYGLVAYAVANDPDGPKVGQATSDAISRGFQDRESALTDAVRKTSERSFRNGLDGLYDSAIRQRVKEAFNGLDIGVVYGLKQAFNVARDVDVISLWGKGIGIGIRRAIKDAIAGFGQGPLFSLSTSIGQLFSLPVDVISSGIGVIASAIRTLSEFFGNLYDIAKSVINFFVEGFGLVASAVGIVVDTFLKLIGVAKQVAEVVKQIGIVALVIGGIVAGFVALNASGLSITTVISGLVTKFLELAGAAGAAAGSIGAVNAAASSGSLIQLEEGLVQNANSLQQNVGLFGQLKNVLAGNGGIGPLLASIGKTFLKFAAVVVIIQGIKSAFDGVKEALDQRDLFQGFLTFLGSLSTGLLRLVGLGNLADQIQVTMDQLKVITAKVFDDIGKQIFKTFSGINVAIQDAVNRTKILVNKDDFVAKAFFKVGDNLKDAGAKSAEEFFTGMQVGLQDPGIRDTISSELIAQGDVVLGKFFEGLTARGGKLTGKDTGFLFEAFKTLDIAGNLKEALDTAATGGFDSLNTIKSVLLGDPELGKKYFADYIKDVVDQAAKGNITKQQIGTFTDAINQALNKGFLNSADAASALAALGNNFDAVTVAAGGAGERFKELNTDIKDLFETAKNNALGDVKAQFEAGKISAEQYVQKLTEFGSTIPTLVSSLRDQQLKDLSDMYNAGVINLDKYNSLAENIIKRARDFSLSAIKDVLNEITGLSTSGATIDTITKSITELNGQLNNLGNVPPDIQARLDKYTKDVAAGILKGADAAKVAESIYKDLAKAQEKVATTVPAPAAKVSTAPVFSATGDIASGVVGDIGAVSDEIDKVQQKIDDFTIEVARQKQKDVEEETKAQDKITKVDDDARAQREKDERDFNIKERQAREDQERALSKISTDASTSLQKAINSRDEQAALAAVQTRDKALQDQKDQFTIDDKRRQDEFKLQQADNEVKRIEDHNAAVKELDELRRKNQQAAAEKNADFQRDIDRERNKTAISKQYKDQEVSQTMAANKAMLSNVISTFGSIVSNSGLLSTQTAKMFGNLGTVAAPIIKAISGVDISGIVNAINLFNSSGNSNTGSTGGGAGVGAAKKRAGGGPIQAGNTYQVVEPESGLPFELARFGNRTYLLARQNGMIEAPTSAIKTSQNGSGNLGGSTNLVLDFSGMVVNGGANANANEIVDKLEQRIIPKLATSIKQLRLERSKL